MNEQARKQLDEILAKQPEELSFDERAFLRARSSYLKKSQVEEYKEVLEAIDEKKPVQNELTYKELLRKARELGFKGKPAKRPVLQEFVHNKINNPFN